MDRAQLTAWVAAYERAWRTAGTGTLASLFSADAVYRPAPFSEPIRGLAAIARMWEAERESPEEAFAMQADVVAVEGDTGVVAVEVRYGGPHRLYRDLWVVRLDETDRCRHFEEWPFWPPGTSGRIAAEPR